MSTALKNLISRSRYFNIWRKFVWWRFRLRQRAKSAGKQAPWTWLQKIATSQIVRITILAPFIGYLILLNESFVEFVALRPEFNVLPTSPPWNLILIYFGSLLTGTSSIIYATSCPPMQRKYNDFPDYRNAERDLWRNPEFAKKKMEDVRAELARDTHDMGIPGIFSSRNHIPLSNLQSLSSDPDKVDEYLFTEWNITNHSRPFRRIACFLCYVSGLTLVAIPSVLTLFKVLRFTAKAIWSFFP